MTSRTRVTVISLPVVALTFIAATAVATQEPTLAITGVNVVDVVSGRIVPNSVVTISGPTIMGVTQDGAAPTGPRVVDGRGKYLIPGLWDMHAHLEMTGQSWLGLYVANGVTGIRDMGSDLDFILRMREGTASGRMLGPRNAACGRHQP